MMYTRSLRISAVLFLTSMMLSAQDVSITDFRIPESRYRTLSLSLSGNLGENWTGGVPAGTGSNGSQGIQCMADHYAGFNSEETNYALTVHLSGGATSGSDQYERQNTVPKVWKNDRSVESFELNFNSTYSRYVTPDVLYWFSSIGGSGSYSLSRNAYEEDGVGKQINFNKSQNYAAHLNAGIGYGRTRDARSVIVILRIMEKLTEDGYLTRSLSNDELIALAEKYEAVLTNNIEHSRPAKYIVRIIFEDLLEKGLITTDKVIAYATERTAEVFQEGIYPRVFGWSVQAGPNIYRTDQLHHSDDPFTSKIKEQGNDLVLRGLYGYPFSTRLHWTSSATIFLPIYGRQNRVDYSLVSTIYYEVGERISANISANLQRSNYFMEGNSFPQGMFNFYDYFNVSSEVNYFIEDQISFYVRGSYIDEVHRSEPVWGFSKHIFDQYSISFGLNYRIF